MLTARQDGRGNVTVGDAGAGGKRPFAHSMFIIVADFKEEFYPENSRFVMMLRFSPPNAQCQLVLEGPEG